MKGIQNNIIFSIVVAVIVLVVVLIIIKVQSGLLSGEAKKLSTTYVGDKISVSSSTELEDNVEVACIGGNRFLILIGSEKNPLIVNTNDGSELKVIPMVSFGGKVELDRKTAIMTFPSQTHYQLVFEIQNPKLMGEIRTRNVDPYPTLVTLTFWVYNQHIIGFVKDPCASLTITKEKDCQIGIHDLINDKKYYPYYLQSVDFKIDIDKNKCISANPQCSECGEGWFNFCGPWECHALSKAIITNGGSGCYYDFKSCVPCIKKDCGTITNKNECIHCNNNCYWDVISMKCEKVPSRYGSSECKNLDKSDCIGQKKGNAICLWLNDDIGCVDAGSNGNNILCYAGKTNVCILACQKLSIHQTRICNYNKIKCTINPNAVNGYCDYQITPISSN